jgi:hypothetical protein
MTNPRLGGQLNSILSSQDNRVYGTWLYKGHGIARANILQALGVEQDFESLTSLQ